MKKSTHILASVVLLNLFAAICFGQTDNKDSSATVSGRITIAGKGAPDITVVAATATSVYTRAIGKVTTDDEGNYRLVGIPPGRITITPTAKAYAISSSGVAGRREGQMINVSAGEEITKIDFTLAPGGVITGRITDGDGSPIIAEQISVVAIDTQDTPFIGTSFGGSRNQTDDRGVYRTYGLAPGKYKVSVGNARSQDTSMYGGSQYIKTFYPGVQEESQATIIEIKEGAEVKDVDIKARKGALGFSASGRVVDSVSGQSAPNIYVGYSRIEDPNMGIRGMNFAASPTDANGKFKLQGLQPGQYAAFTLGAGGENTTYSEPAKFEVIDGDVSGVEIKLGRGVTISGIAVVENNPDPAVAALLPTINLYAYAERKPGSAPSFARANINADGSFKFSGLAPGKIRLVIQEFPAPPKGLSLLRTELNGVDQRDGIEVTAGAEINDLRLVFSYGGGTLRGNVKVVGGTVPPGTMFGLMLHAGPENTRGFKRFIEVDSLGRFSSENVPPGTYGLTLNAWRGNQEVPGFLPVKQTVTITHGFETQVNLEVNLTARKEGSN